ncbi:unnamed protein product [Gordionus sp. m RMFG-2023]
MGRSTIRKQAPFSAEPLGNILTPDNSGAGKNLPGPSFENPDADVCRNQPPVINTVSLETMTAAIASLTSEMRALTTFVHDERCRRRSSIRTLSTMIEERD